MIDIPANVVRRFYKDVMLGLTGVIYDLRVSGLENLPDEPVIITPNHRTFFDATLIEAGISERMGREVRFVYRIHGNNRLWKAIDYLSESLGNIMISGQDYPSARQVVKDAGKELLSKGYDVCIFPEGRFPKTPGLGKFNGGASGLAIETGARIVPVHIDNSNLRLFHRVDLKIGPPISPEGYQWSTRDELSDKVKKSVEKLMPGSI